MLKCVFFSFIRSHEIHKYWAIDLLQYCCAVELNQTTFALMSSAHTFVIGFESQGRDVEH